MLFSLRDIQNYQLRAQDGDFGKIDSFLVDDFEWALRYLVVQVGSRYVMLSVLALGTLDPQAKVIPVNVTREKIMNSPTIDATHPLTRDLERQLSDYYEWPYYWEPDDVPNTLPGDLTAIPLINLEMDREEQEQELIPQTGDAGANDTGGATHLRNTRALFRDMIHTTNDDRSAGKLSDLVVQDEDWNVLYLVVDSGGLLSNRKVLVSPTWVQQIDELDSRIDVDLSEKTIQESPEFNTIDDITDEYRSRLTDHYQR